MICASLTYLTHGFAFAPWRNERDHWGSHQTSLDEHLNDLPLLKFAQGVFWDYRDHSIDKLNVTFNKLLADFKTSQHHILFWLQSVQQEFKLEDDRIELLYKVPVSNLGAELQLVVSTDSSRWRRFQSRKRESYPLIHLAAMFDLEDAVAEQKDLGCSIEMKDHSGDTPLVSAAESNAVKSLTWLIDNGADLDPGDSFPLMAAVRSATDSPYGDDPYQCARILVERGCRVDKDSGDNSETTILQILANSKPSQPGKDFGLEFAKLFLSRCFDSFIWRKNCFGRSPAEIAAKGQNVGLAQFLQEAFEAQIGMSSKYE